MNWIKMSRWRVPVLVTIAITSVSSLYVNFSTISYILRPVWDTPPRPFNFLTHYHSDNVSQSRICELHGWEIRGIPRRVFDAVIFNNEVDILEVRWRELLPHVTKFVVVEADRTFTGLYRPLFFAENSHRFLFAASKIFYRRIALRPLQDGESPFLMEVYQRQQMDRALEDAGIQEDDIVVMSDADEIPSWHTLELFRWCDGFPSPIHLQMKNYVYSFEFAYDDKAWRPSVHVYKPGVTKYVHSRISDYILAESGWHCSFCFRHISEFVFKMKAYSHADRLRRPELIEPERIQDAICRGRDLFGLLPEEYTFRELVGKMGNIPSSFSAVYLPAWLLKNAHRFRFLLPGNCLREQEP